MGVRILSREKKTALFDSVTDTAFGPVFATEEDAESFLEFNKDAPDLRTISARKLEAMYAEWQEKYHPEW